MRKERQDLFYESVGKELTKFRTRKNMSTSQLASRVGEQYNTVKAIEEGKPFMAHQMVWIKSILGINLNILIGDAAITASANFTEEEEANEGDKKENNKAVVDISDFI